MMNDQIKNRRNKFQTGFTLFELLVVIAVIAILAVLVLANYKKGQDEYKVTQAAQRLVSDIRQAQSMAVSGAEFEGSGGGYGIIRVDSDSYILFLKSSDDDGCPVGLETKVVKTVELSGLSLGPVGGQVFFTSPEPKTCIDGDPDVDVIEFIISNDSNTKNVTVTDYGKVEVQ